MSEEAAAQRLRRERQRRAPHGFVAVAGCSGVAGGRLYKIDLGTERFRRDRLTVPECVHCGSDHALARVMVRPRREGETCDLKLSDCEEA